MSVIFCDVNLGAMQQTVVHVGDGFSKQVASVPIDILCEMIPSMCYNLNTFDVKLRGNADYLEGLIHDIQNNELKYNGMNKINIEVV